VYDIRRDRFTQLTFGADRDWYPAWTPDGDFLAFRSGNGLAWIRSDGSGAVERLDGVSANAAPSSFSSDGKWLAFWPIEPYRETWIVPVERTRAALRVGTPRPLPQAGPKGGPAISPDGRWLAYTSYESGRSEVYVTPFAPRGTPSSGKWPVSNDGGFAPVWCDNGRDLFFQSRDGHIQVAAYERRGGSFEIDKPRWWSETRLANLGLSSGYDVAPDGTQVVALLASTKPEMFLHVLLNVGSELRRRASSAGKQSRAG
jgi:Tol biopolymer transport system component